MPGAPDERIRFEAFGPSGIRRPRIAVAIAIAIAIAIAPEKFPVSTSPKSRRQPKSLAARASAHLSFPDRFDHWRSPSAHVMFSSDE
ncbi:hypothetical protein AQ837_31030 [Burkholderia pseudomallei]|uniref:hypothetical protein n=1 Tax=Burkholderia pseudomallei TaxID=28450 RepID=UPI000423BD7C|nr:hypothetical protein [Burkholderia pseudomallei]OMX04310.1 hypothetical protein AQ819_06755 [Burkholderia pseudomallei]OMY14721.1 hypothetical protein AQ837_31030 [Burkholderia pseudomallei]OMY15927.1 hypothetical protein AQ838_02270 [Burkholderia pseudomallei]OMY20339.1 hypothetical protein AQ839_20535 [Burkholderia pseudomallei]OMY21411.1 hypothetical protein AQ840_00290 [Burkholderia pseudomallei]